MTAIHLDLTIYPLELVEQGIAAYQRIASISMRCLDDGYAVLGVVSRGHYDETLVVDEFLNYLIALIVRHPREP
jgi:hypothetical protein